ncbi:hypothetical protein Tsubulata_022638 [Turnera subulata]|uniref:Uncharacterized protein n=1 Tax=Turnera subulata TaxID=218843 RepID=A0A9Q0JKB4_9ROSI|nr:hypothetical protein Tsubulata_022638 [Turnera subulata]
MDVKASPHSNRRPSRVRTMEEEEKERKICMKMDVKVSPHSKRRAEEESGQWRRRRKGAVRE